MNKIIKINKRKIGLNFPPYIIAEMSANHGKNFQRALKIIDLAKKNNADAVKLQTYTSDCMTINSQKKDFIIRSKNIWKGKNLYSLYNEASTPFEWFSDLLSYCKELDITCFSSVFSLKALDLMENLSPPAYKIASFEALDLELIKNVTKTKKPIIISIGLCNKREIDEILDTFYKYGGKQISILRCNSAYPAIPEESNLLTITDLIKSYNIPIGYSDHTLDSMQSIVATSLGASIIEKHFIDKKTPSTPDSKFSITPNELKNLSILINKAFIARGKIKYGPHSNEKNSLVFRRSLYVVEDIKKGDIFSKNNIRSIRPGYGLKPKYLSKFLNKKSNRNLKAGTRLSKIFIDENI